MCNFDIAEKLISRSIKAFELLTESKGTLEKKIDDRIASENLRTCSLLKIINLVAFLGKSCLR